MTKFCEIFKTGTHTSSNGVSKNWTTEDLDLMVSNFQTKNPDVPIVVGHPKTNDPAYGWVESLKRVGDSLFASFKQVSPVFVEAVNTGALKTRSISVAPDGSLRHVGWLGAMPPAVKGLAGFQFQEDENALSYEFSELSDYKFDTTASIFDSIRDFIIEKFGLETADNVIKKYHLENLKTKENNAQNAPAASFGEGAHSNKRTEYIAMPENTQQNTGENYAQKIANFEEQLAEKDKLIEALQSEKAQLDERSRKQKYLQFAQQAVNDGCITPAQKDSVCEFMEAAYKADTINNQDFAEEDENTVSNKFKKFITGLKQVDFSELDPDKVNKNALDFSDPIAVSKAVSEYVSNAKKDGRNISESQALQALKNFI